MAINVLAPFLLTALLMECLANSAAPRVVTVSSDSYRQGGKPRLDDIELQENYSLTRAYGLSKLYVFWVMRAFAKKYPKIAFHTVEPGSTPTSLARVHEQKHPLLAKVVNFVWKPMMWSIEEATATSIYAALSTELEGETGKFYGKCKEKKLKEKWLSERGEQAIWEYCEEACGDYLM